MVRKSRRKQAERVAAGLPALPVGPKPEGLRRRTVVATADGGFIARTKDGKRLLRVQPETYRQLSARHEAAHVVVCHAQGVAVERVTLDAAEAGADNERCDAMTTHGVGTPVENVRIALAGLIQDHDDDKQLGIERPAPMGGIAHDVKAAHEWARLAVLQGVAGQNEESLLSQLYRETLQMLNERQAEWVALVEALLRRTALDEPEILAILGPYPEVPGERLAERSAVLDKLGFS